MAQPPIREGKIRTLAKLNLDLRVLHKRADGYHEIRTVFQTISLADEIQIRHDPNAPAAIQVECDVPIQGENLVERAARLVTSELGENGSLHFQIFKQIPIGAGLGGGSSNAAAVLMALPHFLLRTIDESRRFEWGRELGSDVPFFLRGGTAIGTGRGEELYPVDDFPRECGLLVIPGIHVSTADAYRTLNAPFTPHDSGWKQTAFERFVWERDRRLTQNDFEPAVFAQHPELRDIKDALKRAGASTAQMTGSGAGVYGIFPDSETASAARANFSRDRTEVFHFVNRDEYREMWRKQTEFDGPNETALVL